MMTFDLVLPLFQLISHLHDVVLRRDEAGNPIETKLHQISSDLYTVITNNLQVGEGQAAARGGEPSVWCPVLTLALWLPCIRSQGCYRD